MPIEDPKIRTTMELTVDLMAWLREYAAERRMSLNAAANLAFRTYIEANRKPDRTPPDGLRTRTTIAVPLSVLESLDAIAEENGVSRTHVMIDAVRNLRGDAR